MSAFQGSQIRKHAHDLDFITLLPMYPAYCNAAYCIIILLLICKNGHLWQVSIVFQGGGFHIGQQKQGYMQVSEGTNIHCIISMHNMKIEITYFNSFKPFTVTSQRASNIDCAALPLLWWIFRDL